MTISRLVKWRERVRIPPGFFLKKGESFWLRRLRCGRIAIATAILGTAMYTSMVTAAFLFVRHHRKIEHVQWVDIALPWRWENYRVARGDSYLASAFLFAGEGKFREAFMYARAGIALTPAHHGGRLLLVQLLLATRDTVLARRTLLDGLAYHADDAPYLKATLGFLLLQQEDAHVVGLARKILGDRTTNAEAADVASLAAATACHARGSYRQAGEFLQGAHYLNRSREGRLLRAQIERDAGNDALALIHLRQLGTDFPDDGEIQRTLVEQLRAMGLRDEARRGVIAFQLAHPELPAARIALAAAYHESGDPVRFQAEVAALLRDFGHDEATLTGLADIAVTHGDVPLIHQIADHARTLPAAAINFDFLVAETLIVARDYSGALGVIRGRSSEIAPNTPDEALSDSCQAIAYQGLGDTAATRVFLARFLNRQNLRPENLVAVANRFAAIGANEFARQTLARAVEIDPRCHAALARLVELELELNRVDELAQHVQQLVRLRRPSPHILRVAQQKLGSDVYLFTHEGPAALEAVRAALANANASPRL